MIFPPEFKIVWKQAGIKAAFVSELRRVNPYECENCGGAGLMTTFIAADGPFSTPGTKNGKAMHYHDGKWWVGNTYSANCPVCGGKGRIE